MDSCASRHDGQKSLTRQRKHQYKELVRDLHEDKLRSATSHRGPPLLTAVAARPEGRQKTKSTLSTVINSLDKLVKKRTFFVYSPIATLPDS
jgi:hypothetical protein